MRLFEKWERQWNLLCLRPFFIWSFDCAEGSIPFPRYASPPFILNSLSLRLSSGDFNYHNGFNEPHLRYDAPTLCSDLCDSATIDGSAVAASVKDCSIALFCSDKYLPFINVDYPKEIAISD